MELLSGNEIIVEAALAAGANAFFGYPITPTTEVLTTWAKKAAQNKELIFLQTEDEPAAGFGVLGSALGGRKSWTATAAAGHVLMQDAIVVSEAMRIPFVAYIGQRGGPSTGTVIYSQQELNLARSGGNGEAMRLILGPSNLQELFDFTVKAFDWAWKYHLPVLVLGDGYLSKMTGLVELKKEVKTEPAVPIIQNGERVMHFRNTYSQEEELGRVLHRELKDYGQIMREVEESESLETADAEIVIFAWGTVAGAAREAVNELRSKGYKVGLFRPITLKPFAARKAKEAIKKAHTILIAESSYGQFGRVVTEALFGVTEIAVERLYKPAEGITPTEIEDKVMEIVENV